MVKKLTLAATAAFLSFGIAGAVQASLIGQTVTCSDNGAFANATCQPASASAGPGPEFEIFTAIASSPLWSIDLGADSIAMTFLGLSVGASDPARVTLGDLFWSNDPTAKIVGIANFNAVGVTGLSESAVAVNDNSVSIAYLPSPFTIWNQGNSISFDLVTSHGQLPEPASLALLGFGLLGLGVAARRMRRAREPLRDALGRVGG